MGVDFVRGKGEMEDCFYRDKVRRLVEYGMTTTPLVRSNQMKPIVNVKGGDKR